MANGQVLKYFVQRHLYLTNFLLVLKEILNSKVKLINHLVLLSNSTLSIIILKSRFSTNTNLQNSDRRTISFPSLKRKPKKVVNHVYLNLIYIINWTKYGLSMLSFTMQTSFTHNVEKRWHAFTIPSARRSWSSNGLISYSGTSWGFETTIGVFLIFWKWRLGEKLDKIKLLFQKRNIPSHNQKRMKIYWKFGSSCFQDGVNFNISIVLGISSSLSWKESNILHDKIFK